MVQHKGHIPKIMILAAIARPPRTQQPQPTITQQTQPSPERLAYWPGLEENKEGEPNKTKTNATTIEDIFQDVSMADLMDCVNELFGEHETTIIGRENNSDDNEDKENNSDDDEDRKMPAK